MYNRLFERAPAQFPHKLHPKRARRAPARARVDLARGGFAHRVEQLRRNGFAARRLLGRAAAHRRRRGDAECEPQLLNGALLCVELHMDRAAERRDIHRVALRIFDVMVNDSLVLDDLDVWAESGHDGTCKKVVYAVAKQGLLKIHFPEVKAGQALISGIAIASASQELKPSVFPALGLKASELLSAADRNWAAPDWSWEAADKELLVKTPKELLPEDKNARASVAYEAETAFVKGTFTKREHRKQMGIFFGKGKKNSIEWSVSTGLAQIYALRFKYMNTTGKPLPVRMQFIDSKGVTLKDDILTFPETPDKWKMVSTTTGTFINAGYYKVLLSAEDMNGLAFDALEIQ